MQGASSSAQPSGEVSEELKLLQQRKRESQAAEPSNYAQVLRSARYAANLSLCVYMYGCAGCVARGQAY